MIYSAPPDTSGDLGLGWISNVGGQHNVQDFSLGSNETVTTISVFGLSTAGGVNNTPQAFVLEFFADTAGTPNAASFYSTTTAAIAGIDTGVTLGVWRIYKYTFDVPAQSLSAGTTYWFGAKSTVGGFVWTGSATDGSGDLWFRTVDGAAWGESPQATRDNQAFELAYADHSIVNGDAESGLTGWTSDPAVASVDDTYLLAGDLGIPQAGDYSFVYAGSNGLTQVGVGGKATQSQDIYAWGCGVEYLEGTVTVDYQLSTILESGDTGEVGLGYRDVNDNALAGTNATGLTSAGGFSAGSFSSQPIPTNAFWMTPSLAGKDLGAGDGYADVAFDSVSITTSGCLDNFAKISGKVQGSGQNRGQWSFSGSVGTDEDSGEVVGMIDINYKALGETCTFTPFIDSLFFLDSEDLALILGEVDCEDGDGATTVDGEEFFLALENGDDTTNNKGKNKDRGSICLLVDAGAGDYDIGAPCEDNTDLVALKNGNVLVDDDTSDDAP